MAKPRTRRELIYRGAVVDVFEPDLIVAERIVLELKHQVEGFAPDNVAQVLSYLAFWKLDLGILVNFALDSAVSERIPRQPGEPAIDESYDRIADLIEPQDKPVLRSIREGLLQILDGTGLGYQDTTYNAVASVEWSTRGLSCARLVTVEPVFHERKLPTSVITPFILNEKVCVQVEAVSESITARAIRTMQTHLRLTGCKLD